MTVSTLTFYKVYVAAAAQTIFPYDFMIMAAADLRVYDDGTLQVLGVDYTVSGAGVEGGGNVTFVAGRTAGHSILLRRETPRTQSTDLDAGQQFYEAVIEAMADKLTLLIQESPNASIPLSPAGYYLRIKADGTGIEAVASLALGAAMPFDTGSAAPIDGAWALGFVRFNSAPALGEPLGWINLTGGVANFVPFGDPGYLERVRYAEEMFVDYEGKYIVQGDQDGAALAFETFQNQAYILTNWYYGNSFPADAAPATDRAARDGACPAIFFGIEDSVTEGIWAGDIVFFTTLLKNKGDLLAPPVWTEKLHIYSGTAPGFGIQMNDVVAIKRVPIAGVGLAIVQDGEAASTNIGLSCGAGGAGATNNTGANIFASGATNNIVLSSPADNPPDEANNYTLYLASQAKSYFNHKVGIKKLVPTAELHVVGTVAFEDGIPEYADNAAAVAGGLAIGRVYRTGDAMKIVHA